MTSSISDDHKRYELMLIVDTDLGEEKAKKRLAEIKTYLQEKEGELFFEDVWGTRKFAYPIKKREQGFYAVYCFHYLPSKVAELDTMLRLEREVLRHMIVTLPDAYVPRTLAKMQEEDKKEESQVARETSKEKPKMVDKKKQEKPEVPVKTKEESKPKEEKKQETTLKDVDAKLKSIIDNPDLNF